MAIGNGNDDLTGFPLGPMTSPYNSQPPILGSTAATGDLCLLQTSFQQFFPEEMCHLLSSPLHRGSSHQQS